ncbi:MAG TPA: T9SS type A sorting domain-containing protein [Ignavibacteriaceae bacterium]
MKVIYLKLMTTIMFFVAFNLRAQDISFEPFNTFLYANPGTEIIFEAEITNLTSMDQTVFLVRTINDLPAGWTTSLCFDLCFSSEVDSIATTSTYGSTPLAPGETRVVSVHFFSDNTVATGTCQLQAGTFHDPENRITHNFIATTDPSVSVNESNLPNSYNLSQNYPNPFNPSTRISYNVGDPGLVQLKIFNSLGVEVATLVNEQQYSGNYEVDFNASRLSSGVYFYSLSVNNFTQTRKMILEK